MKLHLGCGTNKLPDYINIDLYEPNADAQYDLTQSLPYSDGSIEVITSSHVIEHFSRIEWERVRKDWARLIQPGGTIEVRCPDIVEICKQFLENPNERWSWWIKTIYGWQGNEIDELGQFHKNGFTVDKLATDFPDFSIAVLPPATLYELHVLLTKHN